MEEKKNSLSKKAVAAAAIGNTLEWYDFSVFAFFASYIGHNFFVEGDETSALFNTFILFGVGFIARPFGAIFLGSYGDRKGRKAVLTLTISLMAIGTAIITFAPPIWIIGIGAPILLFIARLFQGFSAGGEIGGAATFLIEYAPKEKKAAYGSWLQASMALANIISALMGILINLLFTEVEILNWAWRIAFLFGLLIVPVGFFIRKTLKETPEFKNQENNNSAIKIQKQPVRELFKNHLPQLVQGTLLSILWTSSVYTLIIYMPTYYMSSTVGLGFTKSESFEASFVGNIFMIIGCLIGGKLADRYGLYKILRYAIVNLMIIIFPLLYWLHSGATYNHLIVVHILFCLSVALFSSIVPIALSNLYPVSIRSSGISISYNTASILFAGFTPALMTWATKYSVFFPAYYLIFSSIIALIAIQFILKK